MSDRGEHTECSEHGAAGQLDAVVQRGDVGDRLRPVGEVVDRAARPTGSRSKSWALAMRSWLAIFPSIANSASRILTTRVPASTVAEPVDLKEQDQAGSVDRAERAVLASLGPLKIRTIPSPSWCLSANLLCNSVGKKSRLTSDTKSAPPS